MQEKQNKNALIFFRNDLRVKDNAVLDAVLKTGKTLIMVMLRSLIPPLK